MKIDGRVRDHVRSLIASARGLTASPDEAEWFAHSARCQGWIASASNVLAILCPDPLSAYRQQAALVAIGAKPWNEVGSLARILEALLSDIDAGMVQRMVDVARSEVFEGLLHQAEYWLKGGRVKPAGVLAGVIFEDTIRRECEHVGILQKDVDLDALISALRKRERLNDVEAQRARAAAAVRTKATHAQWDEFQHGDVVATIALTQELIDRFMA
jgi:hypothetical protein